MMASLAPSRAVLWQFWWRNRWGFVLSAAYLLAAATVVRVLPPELRTMSFGGGDRPLVADWLGMPCVFVLMHVLAVFTTSEGGLKESGISQHTFVLPVNTRTLVAVPMVAGCLTMAAAWWAIALLVLRPAGANAHLTWPAAALVLSLAILQVGSWLPLAQTWLRVAIVPVAGTGVGFGALMLHLFVPQAALTAMLLAPLPILYFAGVHSVAMARRGDAYDWRAWRRMVERIANWRKPAEHPFQSAERAQWWFEWRAHGWYLPFALGVMVLCIAPLLLLTDRTNIEAGWKFLGMIVVMPMVFALMMGGQVGRQDVWSDYPMTPFLAARPISTMRLVGAKLRTCLECTWVGFLLTLVGVSILLMRPGFVAHIVQVAQGVGAWKSIAIATAGTVGLIAITWLQMASNLWISLTGRAWLVNAFAFTFAALVGAGTLGGLWIYLHAELHGYALAVAPWLMRLMLAAKFVLAIAVLAGLLRTGLVRLAEAGAMVALWCLVAGGFWLIAWRLLPAGTLPPMTLGGSIILLVPLSRLAGAPLALHWNRHR